MIKVLNKAFGILELLVIASPGALKPSRIAASLNINNATCSRILKDLRDAGYVEKISKEEGYTIGPRAFTFSQQLQYQPALLNVANSLLKECAQKLQISIILVELKNNQRYILSHYDFHHNSQIALSQLSYTDLFYTATGTMLLAQADVKTRETTFAEYGVPKSDIFKNVTNSKECHALLDEFKENGEVFYNRQNEPVSIFAVPVFMNNHCVAVLGATFPDRLPSGKQGTLCLKSIRQTAKNISNALTNPKLIG